MSRKTFLILLAFANIIFFIIWLSDIALEKHEWKSFKSSAIETKAEIISIFAISGRGGTTHNVHIEYYDLDNNKHTGKLDYYTEDMDEGDQVTIFYNKNYPDEFMSNPDVKTENRASWFMLILFIDVALVIISFKKTSRNDYYD